MMSSGSNSLTVFGFVLQVYEKYGKELCVVVTNLNMMNAEYFHPKTTPDVPVRQAVRMSLSIPGKPLFFELYSYLE